MPSSGYTGRRALCFSHPLLPEATAAGGTFPQPIGTGSAGTQDFSVNASPTESNDSRLLTGVLVMLVVAILGAQGEAGFAVGAHAHTEAS